MFFRFQDSIRFPFDIQQKYCQEMPKSGFRGFPPILYKRCNIKYLFFSTLKDPSLKKHRG